MSERMKTVWLAGFGLVVAAALAFGGRTALAQPVTSNCPYFPPDMLGACADDEHCRDLCEPYWGPGVGECNSGNCCYCLAE